MFYLRHVLRWLPAAGLLLCLVAVPRAEADSFPWQRYLEYPTTWFEGFEAKKVAANVLSHQSPGGGWPKNVDTGATKYEGDPKAIRGSLEGGSTIGELRFLGRMFRVTGEERYRPPFELGVKYVVECQYETGGWPLISPSTKGFSRFITFGDGHMTTIMEFLHDVVNARRGSVARKDTRDLAQKAFDKGVACIVKCQIVVDDEPTAWCARHDERTLQPRPGRRFEPVSLNAPVSEQILMLLMKIKNPDMPVIRAIHTGCAWFEAAQLVGIRIEKKDGDVAVIRDLDAMEPFWARYYQIGKHRPIFTKRDGSIMYQLSEIEIERRNEAVWYGTWGQTVLKRYAAWQDMQHP